MKGIIKIFKEKEKYGFIVSDGDNKKFFFSSNDVDIDPQQLPFDQDEPVEFDHDKDNPSHETNNKAINIKRENWHKGKVKNFHNKKGFGSVIDIERNTEYFIHYTNVINKAHAKIIRLYKGEDVFFKIRKKDDETEEAFNCNQLDSRQLFFRYFNFSSLPGGFTEAINKLAEISSKEEDADWNYTHETSEFSNPVLYNYLRHTLLRLVEQHNDFLGEKRPAKYHVEHSYILEKLQKGRYLFNTGLQTNYGEDIFAYFEEDVQKISKWIFVDFFIDSDNKLFNMFADNRPELATYLDNPLDFVFDARLTVKPDVKHILDTNYDRLPADIKGKSVKELGDLLRDRTRDAEKKVKRNYRMAIPQFYDGYVQLLLPLCLSASDKVDRALVVERRVSEDDEPFYRGNTILTLSQAYNNARLISPQDRVWLLP